MIINNANKQKLREYDRFVFSPESIELKDDAFHYSSLLPFTEWWYFDATFEDGYSVQLAVRLISLLRRVMAFSRLDIYKDGEMLSHERKTYTMKDFKASTEKPVIKIKEKEIINGYINKEKKWVYELSFNLKDTSADLKFIGCTKGWKGTVPGSSWGVILPRAEVTGIIRLNGKEIKVKGTGYHDHNWNVKPIAVTNMGWLWGKFNSKGYTITWANILKTKTLSYPILVINKKDDEYINIRPEHVKILAEDFRKENGKLIPHRFTIDMKNEDTSLHVNMDVLGIHHTKVMGVMKYWRYHVRCIGYIIVGSIKESIDEIHMAELLRFR